MNKEQDEMMWWCEKCDSPVYDWSCKCSRKKIRNIDEAIKEITRNDNIINLDGNDRMGADLGND